MATFTLSDRQELLYTHRADIWRAPVVIGAKGKKKPDKYSLIVAGVPCYFRKGISVDEPGPTGPRREGDNMFTLETLHWPYELDIQADDVVVNRTLKQDGTPGPTYGRGWRVRGNPRVIDDSPDRDAQHQETTASQIPELPEGVL